MKVLLYRIFGFSFLAASLLLLGELSALAANPDGNLRIEVSASPNFVVDSNVESPSTYAPGAAYIGAKFYNDGTTDMSNVFVNIGNYIDGTSDTPGIYPSRAHMSLVGPLPGNEFALTHEGGSAGTDDAVRYIGTIPAGECVTVYWLVSYPNLDENGDAVHGPSVKPDDDLWLEYDIWATATENGSPLTADVTSKVTMRSEISASANKILPSVVHDVPMEYQDLFGVYKPMWTNTSLVGTPGVMIATEGYWFNLGNVSGGFDNDGDLIPDNNAWLQPVGDPTMFDSSAYRLVRTYALIIVNGGEIVMELEDDLYLENMPENNSVVGMVRYEFMPLLSGASSILTPYQEAASGNDNEKFNGDYGTSVVLPPPPPTELEMEKTVDKAMAWPGDDLWYKVDFTNAGEAAVGAPLLHTPLVVQDSIPAGTLYVSGSAAISNTLPSGVSRYTVLYSTNGTTWSETEPSPASTVTDIQWWLSDALEVAAAGTVTFSVTVDDPYTEPSPVVENVAGLSFGNTAPFLEDDASTLILGLNALGDTVFLDNGSGGGISGNGIQDGTESGIQNVTVDLYLDVDGDGVLDASDVKVGTTTTGSSGHYSYTNLADGMFLVKVDDQDSDIPYGSAVTRPTIVSVDLDSAGTNAIAVTYLDADFGFAPVLALDKSIVGSVTNREGDTITYNIVVTNNMAGNGGAAIYDAWVESRVIAAKPWTSPENAHVPPGPDGLYASDTLENTANTLTLYDFRLTTPPDQVISNVAVVLPMLVTGTFTGGDTLEVSLKQGATSFFTTNFPADQLTGMLDEYSMLVFDVTSLRSWQWSDFNGTNMFITLVGRKAGAPDTGTVFIDAAGYRITTDWISGTNNPALTLNPVPLTDTYDADVLEYLSAEPVPKSVTTSGTAPDMVGTITWGNIGPVFPGGSESVTVNFTALEPRSNMVQTVTNTAFVSNVKYADGRPANSATDNVPTVVLPAGAIGDYVWRDLDADGVQDGGNESGIGGVSVRLTPPAGVDIGSGPGNPITNVTDETGLYLFTGLPADGNYTVTVITSTLPGGSGTCTYDEDNGTSSPNSATVVNLNYDATDGSDTHLTADFGYTVVSSIDGTVWNDMDRLGGPDQGEDEPWLTGVTVYLFSGTTPGTPGEAIATTTTSANGYFLFTGAYSGDYCIQVLTNSGDMSSGTWVQSFDTDGLGSADYVSVNVVSGGHGEGDFSYYNTGPYDVGDTLFYDRGTPGVQDVDDEGIKDITVYLYRDFDGDGDIDAGIDAKVGTTVTDTNGMYLFPSVIAANYIVVVDLDDPDMPPLYNITVDPDNPNDGRSSFAVTTADRLDQDFGFQPYGIGIIGDTVWLDYYGDGIQSGPNEPGIPNITVSLLTDWDEDGTFVVQSTTVTDADGWYQFPAYPDGDYIVRVDTNDVDLPVDSFANVYALTTSNDHFVSITNGSIYLDADFGFTALGAIGDTIFWDSNRDGEKDGNEAGIPGVTVNLYIDNNADGYYDGGDTFYGSKVTTNNGFYVFSGLVPGDYVVVVDTDSTPIAGTLLAADPSYIGYAQDPGAVDADSEYGVNLNLGERFYGADFGYVPDGVIGDTVWLDFDNDGLRGVDEDGIPYVTVNLYTNGTLAGSVETDFDGWYIFSGVIDATYTVVVDTNDVDFPAGLSPTYDADGTLDHQAVDIVISGGHMITVNGSSFTNELGIDFGYRYVGTNVLSGTIGFDAQPYDGVMGTGNSGVSSNESAFSFEKVYLFLWDDDGDNIPQDDECVSLGETFTDENGDYSFTELSNGGVGDDYLVRYNPSAESLIMTTTNGSTPATSVSNEVNASGFTVSAWQAITIDPVVTNIDFAFRSSITYDYGDLPVGYGTLFQDDGPSHIVPGTPDLYLGASVDTEDNGMPSVGADGDGADDDGISIVGGCWKEGVNGGHIEVDVGEGSGWLVGFIDFNNDGDLLDAGEMIISAAVSTNGGGGTGIYTNDFTVPSGTLSSTNVTSLYARFRLFKTKPTVPELSYAGSVYNGEVEDYLFKLGTLGDYVWKDQNGDGVQDVGEQGLANVLVYVDLNEDGIYQSANEPSAMTDANGFYGISGFTAGTYDIRVDPSTLTDVLWPSYDLDGTNTPHVAVATMTNAQLRADVDFGYFPGYIDVGVGKNVNDAPAGYTNWTTIGSNLLYRMLVTNFGPIVATELEFTDNLPEELIYVSHTTSTGTYDEVSGIWDIGTLAVSGTAELTITAYVGNTNYDRKAITNWIYLTNLYQNDTNPTNNQASVVIKPTVVVLSRFEALNVDGKIALEWETSSELGTVGFYLMRKAQDSEEYVQVNAELLPVVPGAPQGGVYRVIDPDAEPGRLYTYVLLEIEMWGEKNRYGPYKVLTPNPAGIVEKVSSWFEEIFVRQPEVIDENSQLMFNNMSAAAKTSQVAEHRPELMELFGQWMDKIRSRWLAEREERRQDSSVVKGPVLKVIVDEPGVVSISAAQFIDATGLDTNEVMEAFTTRNMALSCNGAAVPYLLNSEGDGILFYGQKIDSTYTDSNVYVLKSGIGLGMAVLEGEAPEIGAPATYTENAHFEQEVYSVGAMIPDPDADHWMWSFFIGDNAVYGKQTYTIAAPGASGVNGGTLTVRMHGGSSTGVAGEHIIRVLINGISVGSGFWSGVKAYDLEVALPDGLLVDGDNQVQLIASKAPSAAYSVTYLNEFDLSYPRKQSALNDAALLRDAAAGVLTVGGFDSPVPAVWDIEDPDAPIVLGGINAVDGTVSFNAEESHDYVLFGQAGVQSSLNMSSMNLGLLKSRTNDADYIIITVPELQEAAQRLAGYRGGLGLKVRTVLLENIYDEFSHGIETPEAIKSFLAYAYSDWRVKPSYAVLAGEGTYDYKGTMGAGDCLLPPMLVSTPWGLFASDNWFVDFDDDQVPEIPIGRLPAKSAVELTVMVDKIIAYEAVEEGVWQKKVLMLADDRDTGGNFAGASDSLAHRVPEGYSIDKAYLGEGSTADVRGVLMRSLNNGAAFMSYFGHSGLDRMANEGLLTVGDVATLSNGGKLPVLTSMSCMMGRFAIPGYDSLAEELILKDGGGCIAVWTPVGMSYNTLSRVLAEKFYEAVFDGGEGVLGDAMLVSMRGYAAQNIELGPLSSYGLLGDPALRMTGRPRKAYSVNLARDRWLEEWLTELSEDYEQIADAGSDIDSDWIYGLLEEQLGSDWFYVLMDVQFGADPLCDADVPPPVITITTPTTNVSYKVNALTIDLAGTLYNQAPISDMMIYNSLRGSAETCVAAENWSFKGLRLQPGENEITVICRDVVGNESSDSITVIYRPNIVPILKLLLLDDDQSNNNAKKGKNNKGKNPWDMP